MVKSSVSICKLICSCSVSMAWIAAASSKRQIRTITPSVSTRTLFRILGSRNSEACRSGHAGLFSFVSPDADQRNAKVVGQKPDRVQLIARALARHESERMLKELEEPYVTRTDPYLESKPITDPTWFFGRQELLNRLTSILAQGQHGGIFGLRKIGKTSLINQVQQRFGRTPTALLDCQAFGTSATEYLQEISSQLTNELSRLGVCGVPAPPDDRHDPDAFRKHLFDLVQAWRALGREEPILIIMDEIDKLFPCENLITEKPHAPLFAWFPGRLPTARSRTSSTSLVLKEYVRLFRILRGVAQTQNCIVLLLFRPERLGGHAGGPAGGQAG
jgi:AAA domain